MKTTRFNAGLAALALTGLMLLAGCSDDADEPTDDPDVVNPDNGTDDGMTEETPTDEPLPEDEMPENEPMPENGMTEDNDADS